MQILDQDTLGRVQNIARDIFGEERFAGAAFDRNSELITELGFSSLEIVTLLTELESTLGLRVPATQIPITELITVADLIRQTAGQSPPPSGTDPIADSMKRGSRRRRRP